MSCFVLLSVHSSKLEPEMILLFPWGVAGQGITLTELLPSASVSMARSIAIKAADGHLVLNKSIAGEMRGRVWAPSIGIFDWLWCSSPVRRTGQHLPAHFTPSYF